jgi:tRNA 2-thiouridine synthesizing protein C
MSNSNYVYIQTNAAPYSTGKAIDAYEAALGATNIGLHVKFVFANDGVYQLLSNQQPELISHKSIAKKLSALPLFDVEDIFVCEASTKQRNIHLESNSVFNSLEARAISNTELYMLQANAAHVLIF